jgi:hypothetical protein
VVMAIWEKREGEKNFNFFAALIQLV